MTRLATLAAWATTSVVALALALPARADEGATADPALSFEARSVFGETSIDTGGDEIYVRIENAGATARQGSIDLIPAGWGMPVRELAKAKYAVPPGAAVTIHLPVTSSQAVAVVAHDERGVIRFQVALSPVGSGNLRMVDIEEVSRIGSAVGMVPIDPEYRVQSGYTSYGPAPLLLQIPACRFDRATGDPILPEYASGWRSVQAAIIKSDTLAGLGGAELAALESFVLGGGTIAVVVAHDEDLAQPTLVALLGGRATKARPSSLTLSEIALATPSGSPPRWPVNPKNPADSTEVSSYAGGNLEPSAFGASAAYGLGEVVLLGFDPTAPEVATDPWVELRMADLARRAYERNATVVFGPASPPVRSYAFGYEDALRDVRRVLDPNQSARFAIGIATVLLCIYAVIAGPLVFWRARKRNRPLRALVTLPLLSALTFALVVAIGLVSRGSSSRSRRLTLVDAGAGMSRGVAHRFRGFFAASSSAMTVSATDRTTFFSNERAGMLDEGDDGQVEVVGEGGARLEHVAAIPWQTVIVEERGLSSLGEGISVSPSEAGSDDVIVKNRTGKRLRAVVIKLASGAVRFTHEIAQGQRIDTRDLAAPPPFDAWQMRMKNTVRTNRTEVHPLNVAWLGEGLRASDDADIGAAWVAADSTVTGGADWLPRGVPIVLAAFDGGDASTTDTGMKIDFDRTLIRVVGWGGEP